MSDKPASGEWTALRAQLVKEGLPEDHINQIIDGMNRDIQSKPATGRRLAASGEWTADTVRGLLPYENPCWIEEDGSRTYISNPDLQWIADAHNAALAAKKTNQELIDEYAKMMDALAAEREIVSECNSYVEQNKKALAAEREKREQAENDFILAGRNNEQLRKEIQQLQGQVALMTVERNEARNAHKLIAQKRRIIEGLQTQVKELEQWKASAITWIQNQSIDR